MVILTEVFRHPLGEGGHQHPSASGNFLPDFPEQMINLAFCRHDLDHGIHQSGRPDNLLDHFAGRMLQFILAGSGRHIDHLIEDPLELPEFERPVVDR